MTPDDFSSLPAPAQARLVNAFLDAEGADLVAELDGTRDRWDAWCAKWRKFVASQAAVVAASEAA